MKFAKEIEDDAVPEWRDKYLEYKTGKKLIKQVARTVRDTGTPPAPLLPPSPSSTPLLLPLPEPALDLPPRRRNTQKLGSRLRSYTGNAARTSTSPAATNVALHSRPEVEEKKQAFLEFLNRELGTVEEFYRDKEEESTERLGDIREQLHLLRAQRTIERAQPPPRAVEAIRPFGKPLRSAVKRVRFGAEPAKKSRHSPANFTPPSGNGGRSPHHQDYERKPVTAEVSYDHAKRRLKRAMVEFYRSLELLKSYALVNHKAFRKINKKYDKAVHARHPMRYFQEKITKAYFVRSEVVDSHIKTVEDLYARYFEGDSRKLAIGKLRRKQHDPGEYISSVFRNGLMVAAGLTLGIEGLYYGGDKLFNADPTTMLHTSYLLQLYAGYFLMLLLMIFFAAACCIFEKTRINYVFVFELDVRHNVNWRQMFELPCLFILLLGLTMILNFLNVGGPAMYIFWPVVLIGLTVLIIFLPFQILYWRPRLWFANSLRRLILSPLPRVEFRDFFLGDMFCSQSYAMGNIELFFCLYANDWINPVQCNSNHSRLLGFFSALPGVWRFLQCLRRYYDTRNLFPHLVNGGKYTFTFMQYASLSMYRISRTNETFAAFVAISTINSTYCFIWDVLMDWSLGNPNAPHKYLRPQLGYERVWWVYYLAIGEDLVLRFSWIFYAIFRNDAQHSALLSFVIALAEVCRRAIWVLFRVENEHCANIARHRAIKDMSLPYEPRAAATPAKDFERRHGASEPPLTDEERNYDAAMGVRRVPSSVVSQRSTASARVPGTPGAPAKSPSIRTRVGDALFRAHTQDFERRSDLGDGLPIGDSDDDDDDDDSDSDVEGSKFVEESAEHSEEVESEPPETGSSSRTSGMEELRLPRAGQSDDGRAGSEGGTVGGGGDDGERVQVQVQAGKPGT